MRAGFGIGLATAFVAMAAILALAQRQPFAVDVSLARIADRLRKRIVTEFLARRFKQQRGLGHLQWRIGIFVASRSFKNIAAGNFLPAQISGLARNTAKLVELVVIGLELLIGHRPVLDRHVFGDGTRPVAIDDV